MSIKKLSGRLCSMRKSCCFDIMSLFKPKLFNDYIYDDQTKNLTLTFMLKHLYSIV